MKDRKTLLIFLIPLLFFLLGTGGSLLYREITELPDPPAGQIREAPALWRREDHPLDLNEATVEELLTLLDIGQVTAQRIVDYRELHGDFRSVEEIMRVRGIGVKEFKKLRSFIYVEE